MIAFVLAFITVPRVLVTIVYIAAFVDAVDVVVDAVDVDVDANACTASSIQPKLATP